MEATFETYVESGIGSNEGKGIAHHTNHERDAICRPSTVVNKCTKDIRRRRMRSKSNKRDQDGKETENVQDQDQSLKLGQHRTDEGVDEDGKPKDGPEQQCSLPKLRLEVGIIERRHSQDHVSREQGAGRY